MRTLRGCITKTANPCELFSAYLKGAPHDRRTHRGDGVLGVPAARLVGWKMTLKELALRMRLLEVRKKSCRGGGGCEAEASGLSEEPESVRPVQAVGWLGARRTVTEPPSIEKLPIAFPWPWASCFYGPVGERDGIPVG
jgi:hypothetical protein